jgi:hypothetical protein
MAPATAKAFTFINRTVDPGRDDGSYQLFNKFGDLTSAKVPGLPFQLLTSLRAEYPEHVVTYAHLPSLPLLAFAACDSDS